MAIVFEDIDGVAKSNTWVFKLKVEDVKGLAGMIVAGVSAQKEVFVAIVNTRETYWLVAKFKAAMIAGHARSNMSSILKGTGLQIESAEAMDYGHLYELDYLPLPIARADLLKYMPDEQLNHEELHERRASKSRAELLAASLAMALRELGESEEPQEPEEPEPQEPMAVVPVSTRPLTLEEADKLLMVPGSRPVPLENGLYLYPPAAGSRTEVRWMPRAPPNIQVATALKMKSARRAKYVRVVAAKLRLDLRADLADFPIVYRIIADTMTGTSDGMKVSAAKEVFKLLTRVSEPDVLSLSKDVRAQVNSITRGCDVVYCLNPDCQRELKGDAGFGPYCSAQCAEMRCGQCGKSFVPLNLADCPAKDDADNKVDLARMMVAKEEMRIVGEAASHDSAAYFADLKAEAAECASCKAAGGFTPGVYSGCRKHMAMLDKGEMMRDLKRRKVTADHLASELDGMRRHLTEKVRLYRCPSGHGRPVDESGRQY